MENEAIIQDFLAECRDNLSQLEWGVLALEDRPDDRELLGSIFQTLHTVKGTCGFLGFEKVAQIADRAESLFSVLRDGERRFTHSTASLLMETLDAVHGELDSIGATGAESDVERAQLLLRLRAALDGEEPISAACLPLETVWHSWPEMVSRMGRELHREIRLELEGGNVTLDQRLLKPLQDALTHILRHACHHGIETNERRMQFGKPAQAVIRIRALQQAEQVTVEVSDDGCGLRPESLRARALEIGLVGQAEAAYMSEREAIDLLFHPACSSAGWHSVRRAIESNGGCVEADSREGVGMAITLRLPRTLCTIRGRGVVSSAQIFVIPQSNLVGLAPTGDLETVPSLSQLLGLPGPSGKTVIVLEEDGIQFALRIERILSAEDLVLRPLGQPFRRLRCYSGAAILSDGTIALVLDAAGLAARSKQVSR